MRVATIALLKAGGALDGTARLAAVTTIAQSGTPDYSEVQLQHDLDAGDVSALPAYLSPLANGLSLQGKENFVGSIVEVAKADGPMTPDERGVVTAIGSALGLSSAHLAGIIATAGSSTRASDESVSVVLPGPSRRDRGEAAREPAVDAHREARILPPVAGNRQVAVLRQRGHDGHELGEREMLADAPARPEPEGQQ